MLRMKRFFYVRSLRGRVRHIQFGTTHSEGPVACGLHSEKGWLWCRPENNEGFIRTCTRCQTAATRITKIAVARVRNRK